MRYVKEIGIEEVDINDGPIVAGESLFLYEDEGLFKLVNFGCCRPVTYSRSVTYRGALETMLGYYRAYQYPSLSDYRHGRDAIEIVENTSIDTRNKLYVIWNFGLPYMWVDELGVFCSIKGQLRLLITLSRAAKDGKLVEYDDIHDLAAHVVS